jgi:tetratricopeptide (TPR) repeat protein
MKKYILILLILFPIFVFSQANKLIRQGLKAEDLEEQIRLFSEAINIEPDNLDAYFYRAVAKHNIGDFNGAILDYTKVAFKEPTADVYFNRGNSRYSLMDYYGAKEDYTKALELNKDFIEAKFSLAVTLNDLEDYEGAIKELEVPNLKNSAAIYLQLARAYNGLKNFNKALENYNAAVLISPSTRTFFERGRFFMSINYYKKANEDFNRAVFLEQGNLPAGFFRGTSFLLLGKFKEALNDFSALSEFDITDFDAAIGLSMTYQGLNDMENAKKYFTKAKSVLLGLNPDKPNNIELFQDTYWYQKQFFVFNEFHEKMSVL